MELIHQNSLYIMMWILLLYFLGLRRLTLLMQGSGRGRFILRSINWYSAGGFKSYLSGLVTSFFMHSPFGAAVHIKQYCLSGLINLKQMTHFLAGSHIAVALTPMIFFMIPTLPQNILLTTLIFSVFIKVFFARFRYWLIDFLIIVSIVSLSINSVNMYPVETFSWLSIVWNETLVLAMGFMLALIFKSQVYCIMVAVLMFRFLDIEAQQSLYYVFGFQLGFAFWHLVKSFKYNRSAKYAFTLNFISVALICIFIYLMDKLFINLLSQKILILLEVTKQFLSDYLFSNQLFETPIYTPKIIHEHASQLVAINAVFCLSLSLFIAIINLLFSSNLMTTIKKKKDLQVLKFIDNKQFYSPYLFLDFFKKEVKKMAALLQSIVTVALEPAQNDKEPPLRSKKYALILEQVKKEARDYSVEALKRINIPKPNQEFLYYLQMSEVIDKLSQRSLELINIREKVSLNEEQKNFTNQVLKNYDHLFEVLALDKKNIYCVKNTKLQSESEVNHLLKQLDSGVDEVATIIKNINRKK